MITASHVYHWNRLLSNLFLRLFMNFSFNNFSAMASHGTSVLLSSEAEAYVESLEVIPVKDTGSPRYNLIEFIYFNLNDIDTITNSFPWLKFAWT